MGVQIPVIVEKDLTGCGDKKFQIDPLGNHLCTCTTHSGVKTDHDWTVGQITDLFHTTNKTKTEQVARSRGQQCGDIQLTDYLVNTTDLEVALTSTLMDTYIILMIWIGH
jgi:hypothetical protein